MLKSWSGRSLLFCIFVSVVVAFLFYPRWNKSNTEATLSWDASGYYFYLPAIFIYQDIKQIEFKDSIMKKYYPAPDFQQAFYHVKSGNYVMKYSSGQALAELPFFTIGHLWAKNSSKYPADGFSYPYQKSIGVGMFLLSLIGLFYLRKILLLFFKDSTVAILLLAYVIGTNYINYAAIDQAMTHSTLFTIYALLIWHTIKFYKHYRYKNIIFIGFLCGLACLIRPTEIISVLIPLLWNITNFYSFKQRIIQLTTTHFSKVLFAGLVFLGVIVIQPIYWKYVSGEWIVYSYQDQGFSWLNPHFRNYLMSYWSGWWRYSPMMVLPFVGLFIYRSGQPSPLLILGFSLLSLYIVCAWDVWDYGGTGGRAMVQYYPILAFPFSALIEKTMSKSWLKWPFIGLLLGLAYINIWWVYNAHSDNVKVLGLSKAYYWAKIGRWSEDEDDLKLMDNPDAFRGQPQTYSLIYSNDFEKDNSDLAIDVGENKVIKMNQNNAYSPIYEFENNLEYQKWMRVKALFYCDTKEWDLWKQTHFYLKFYNDQNQEKQSNMIKIQRFIKDGEIRELYFDAKMPSSWAHAKVYLYNPGSSKEIWMDNLEVITFDK